LLVADLLERFDVLAIERLLIAIWVIAVVGAAPVLLVRPDGDDVAAWNSGSTRTVPVKCSAGPC
jgi:hypothetical protein